MKTKIFNHEGNAGITKVSYGDSWSLCNGKETQGGSTPNAELLPRSAVAMTDCEKSTGFFGEMHLGIESSSLRE